MESAGDCENIRMKRLFKRITALASAAALTLSLAACGGSAVSGPKNTAPTNAKPVSITVWTYYNGDQLETFSKLVDEFNATVGKEQNITVEASSQGSVNDLETNVLAAAEGKVGAAEMPNIFSAYADTCYAVDQMGLVADLSGYLTDEEKAAFPESYLTEGDFDDSGTIKIFPVAKSTELLFLNDTDWQAFADAADVRYEDLATMEGLTAAAEKYYNWTDAQTAAPDDGKALFGRDAMANYMLVGAQQLGDTIFAVKDGRMTVNFERDVARRLWDNYYVPFVRGWFAATGRFRSDDIKTGNVLAYVGSSSSATFFPARVTNDANESHEISLKTLPAPQFEGGEAVAVQQGAGMVVTAAKEEEVKASVEFLKWFVRAENNIAFSVGSGYLPVTRKANDMQEILASGLTLDDNMQQTLAVAVDTVNGNRLYTPHAFAGSNSARKVLEYGLSDLAAADRETVVQRIAEGRSAAEAEAEFLTDEYFEAWYQDICAKLAQYEG